MISATPNDLDRARLIGELRGPSAPDDGALTWRHSYVIEYAGDGFLQITLTDNRVVWRTRILVDGHDEPWSVVIAGWRFDHVRFAEGGRLTICPNERSRLVLTQSQLTLPFPARPLRPGERGPWPDFPEQTAPSDTIDTRDFAAALRCVPGATGTKDETEHVVSGYEDGSLIAVERASSTGFRLPAFPSHGTLLCGTPTGYSAGCVCCLSRARKSPP